MIVFDVAGTTQSYDPETDSWIGSQALEFDIMFTQRVLDFSASIADPFIMLTDVVLKRVPKSKLIVSVYTAAETKQGAVQ